MPLEIAYLVNELWEDLGRLYDDVLRIENRRDEFPASVGSGL